MRSRPPRLGELLEARGWITREQLLRALRNQKVVGGKLGTCLLEIDALSEDSLARGLSEQQGVPPVTPEDLRGIPEEVVQLLPAKVARRLLAVPFRGGGTQIHVAVLDARDLAVQDELAFVSGRRVHLHVASEVRLFETLEKLYGEECPPRLAKLLDRLNRSRFLWRGEAVESPEAPPSEALRWDPRLGRAGSTAAPADPAFLPTFSTESAPELPAPPAPAAAPLVAVAALPAPSPLDQPATASAVAQPTVEPEPAEDLQELPDTIVIPALTLDEAERRLLSPEDRDSVGRVLLEFAAPRVRRVLLFKVHREEVASWMAGGEPVDRPRFEAFHARLDLPSVFLTLSSGAALARGVLADLPVHAELAAALPGPPAADALVLPIRVRGRLVAVLYAEPAATAFEPAAVADLQRLCSKAAIAFELFIMRAKLRRA